MKCRSLIVLAIFALCSTSAYAAGNYTCTASSGAGIYDLTLDGGNADLQVDGVMHIATGAGEYFFNDSFEIGDVFLNSPTLYIPMDGSTSDIQFTATISDDTGSSLDLNCSQ
jgi:hypothetical protein